MPDYSGLLQALAGEQQSYAQQNPWIIGGQAVLKTPVYATNETDPLQTALVQALQGLVGGFATSYGQGQVKTQSDALMGKLQTALAGAAQGGSLGEALLADPDTKVLGETAYLEEQIRKAEDVRKQKELENQLILKAQYDTPEAVDVGETRLLYGSDPVTGKKVKIGEFKDPSRSSSALGLSPVSSEFRSELGAPSSVTTSREVDQWLRSKEMGGVADRFTKANLPEPINNAVIGAGTLNEKLGAVYERVKKLVEEPGNPQAKFAKIKLSSVVPASEIALLKEWMNYNGFDLAIDLNGGGRSMSDQDRQAVTNFIAGDAAMAAGEIKDRFEHILNIANTKAVEGLRVASKQSRMANSAKEVARDFYSQLDNSSKRKLAPHFESILGLGTLGEPISPNSAPGGGPPPFDPLSQRLLQNPKTGEFKVVPR